MNALVAALREAGLTGRGGAGFPAAIKAQAAMDQQADLIVNVCDGDRGAAKDTWVIEHHFPEVDYAANLLTQHGQRTIWYAAHRDSPAAALLHRAGVNVLETPRRYVSSEGTALVSLAHTGVAKPIELRRPSVYGGRTSDGRRIPPTVVFNAETLWRMAQIVENGPRWFSSFGTPEEPGPRLVTIFGYVHVPLIMQTQAGVALSELFAHAGGLPTGAQSIMLGGLGGGYLPAEQALGLRWGKQWLAPYGLGISSGLVEVMDPRACPLAEMGAILDYAAGESAGQCGPCMFGLPALARDWRELVAVATAAPQQRQGPWTQHSGQGWHTGVQEQGIKQQGDMEQQVRRRVAVTVCAA